MAPFSAHTGRLEAGGSRTHDRHASLRCRSKHDMRHLTFAAGGCVVHAKRFAADEQTIDAVIGTDALANLVDSSFLQLVDDMRVGEMRAGHADEIDMTVSHCAC